MKARLCTLLLAAAFLLSAQQSNATIRRVGYWGTPRNNVDYSDLQSAHDAANSGDTLLIFPGSWYAMYSKRLVTLGYGYFTDTATLSTQANPGLQNIKGTLSIGITLTDGSNNCIFEGLDGVSIGGDGSGSSISGIIVRRCKGTVWLSGNNVHNNWQILQSYLDYLHFSYYGNIGTISSLVVNNCVIGVLNGWGGAGTAAQTGQFNNCIFSWSGTNFDNGSFIIKNSTFLSGRAGDANCVYQYNLFNSDYSIPSGTGNIGVDGATMGTNVFVGYGDQGTYSNDGMWALKAGSPAKGKAEGGTDIGIYGGTNPYKLSGIPRVPAIYKLTAPSTVTSGNPYTITLSVRSNN